MQQVNKEHFYSINQIELKIDNRKFKRVKDFKYSGKILTKFYSGRN